MAAQRREEEEHMAAKKLADAQKVKLEKLEEELAELERERTEEQQRKREEAKKKAQAEQLQKQKEAAQAATAGKAMDKVSSTVLMLSSYLTSLSRELPRLRKTWKMHQRGCLR
jgi:hypothetical protein